MFLEKLLNKLPHQNKPKHNTPFVFTLIRKCSEYRIPYELMCRLNYYDLIYLVTEYDISSIQDYLRNIENSQNQQRGYQIIDATNDMILKMHKRGGVRNGSN